MKLFASRDKKKYLTILQSSLGIFFVIIFYLYGFFTTFALIFGYFEIFDPFVDLFNNIFDTDNTFFLIMIFLSYLFFVGILVIVIIVWLTELVDWFKKRFN